MNKTFKTILFILFSTEVIKGCSIKILDVDEDYGCGIMPGVVYQSNELPSEFVGAQKLTLGLWFKDNRHLTDPEAHFWSLLFKLAETNSEKNPAVYLIGSYSSKQFVHQFLTDGGLVEWTGGQSDKWYFALEAININSGQSTFVVVDPSKTTTADSISITFHLTSGLGGFSYSSNHKIYFGSDDSTSPMACLAIWKPFIITGYNPINYDLAVITLAFGVVPSATSTFLLQPYDVYENLFDYSDDLSLLSTPNDPGFYWSATKSYFSLPSYGSSPESQRFSAIKWSLPFNNTNGSLSFSARFGLILQKNAGDTCGTYWIIRRYTTQALTFGFGISSTGQPVIQLATNTKTASSPIIPFNTSRAFLFGCYGQWLSQTVCSVFFGTIFNANNVGISYFPKSP